MTESTKATKRAAAVARSKKLHDLLAAQRARVEADAEVAAQFAELQTHLSRLSVHNILLVLAQHPDATDVAGFRQWQKQGRQVRKGEHGIRIFGYSKAKAKDKGDGDEEGDDKGRVYFPVLTVFDVSQTDPMEVAA